LFRVRPATSGCICIMHSICGCKNSTLSHWQRRFSCSRNVKAPNATRQPRLEARVQRTLEGVGWTRWLGAGGGRDTVLTRLLHGPGASLYLEPRTSVTSSGGEIAPPVPAP
jgi:hypothetical protein